ncbi:hypothetical protein [Tardiphaga sp.]|jgi:hypothetical protein|uniref:hypothetical protein n=1 Tax=Tardiphaga sp. TaxID=1926292 RepID=UPI0019C98937|nr:hypothetical protein [Tardiphaga sp.]MBC7576629.1 hypothetical protein [Tardiphaga sp.]
MVARFVLGAAFAASLAMPAMAGSMTADEARKFVAGKVFAFTCFDGTRGAGRVFDDGGAAGAVQFSGSGPARNMRLPGNTLQVRGQSICASIKGLPFEPCFNLVKNDERSFRGAVSGMGFAYCDFRHQGRGQMLMARSLAQPQSLRAADASPTETVARVATPRVEIGKIESVSTGSIKIDPLKSEPAKPEIGKSEISKPEPARVEAAKSESAKVEGTSELRRSTE